MDIKSFIAGTVFGAVAIEFIEHIVLKRYPGDENRKFLGKSSGQLNTPFSRVKNVFTNLGDDKYITEEQLGKLQKIEDEIANDMKTSLYYDADSLVYGDEYLTNTGEQILRGEVYVATDQQGQFGMKPITIIMKKNGDWKYYIGKDVSWNISKKN